MLWVSSTGERLGYGKRMRRGRGDDVHAATMMVARAAARRATMRGGRSRLVATMRRNGGKGFMREVQDVREGREDGVKEIDFQAPLQIVKYPDPRLRAKNMRIDEFGDSLREFAKEMLVAMVEYDGIGLAAPQVGVNVRLMVFNPEGDPEKGPDYVLVNPRIVKSSNRHSVFEEGCISFPDIYAEVLRPERVTVEYQDLDGKKCKMQLNGLKARVFQHEYDHLQGVLFHDRMSPEVLETVRNDLEAMEQDFARENPGVQIRKVAKVTA